MARADWRLVFLFWAVVALVFAIRTWLQYGGIPLVGGGDDATRMVTATDLLNGQNWFDSIEHRDNTPFGADMHWSRLIDTPIAALIAVFRPFFGLAIAKDIAATTWPLLLFLPLLALEAAIARAIMPAANLLPAVVLPVLALAILDEFRPGRVDHHNVQLVLCLVGLLAFLAARTSWRGGVVAGLALATSLAIGLETVTFVAGAIAILSLLWVIEPERYRSVLIGFAASLFLGALGHFFILIGPARYTELFCDVLGIPYLFVIGTSALAMLIAAFAASKVQNVFVRLVTIGGLGGAGALGFALLFPQCLAGPYGIVDPRIIAAMYGDIAEAQGLGRAIMVDPSGAAAFALAALAALPITAWLAFRSKGDTRVNWIIVLVFLVIADGTMLFQMRGAKFAAAYAIPSGVFLINAARQRYLASRKSAAVAGLVGSWLLYAGAAQALIVGAPQSLLMPPRQAPTGLVAQSIVGSECLKPPYLAKLAELPPGRVMAPIRIGPLILNLTPHSIVSSGFHRNNAGTLDVLAFYPGTDAERREILERRGVDYVVSCGMSLSGEGLVPISEPGDFLQIYKVSF